MNPTEAMMDAWAEAQKTLMRSWQMPMTGATTAPPFGSSVFAASNPFTAATEQWRKMVEGQMQQWLSAGQPTAKQVADSVARSQESMMQFVNLSAEALQAMTTAVQNNTDVSEVIEAYSKRMQDMMTLPMTAFDASQDVSKLWQQYVQETQRMTGFWLEPLSQAMSTMGKQWLSPESNPTSIFWDSFERSFGKYLNAPTMGYSREFNEKLLKGFDAWLEMRRKLDAYEGMSSQAWATTFQEVSEHMLKLMKEGVTIDSYKDLVNTWVKKADEVFLKVFYSEEYVRVQSEFVNSLMRYRLQERAITETFLEMQGLPTRSEVDEIHEEIYKLRKELKALKRNSRESSTVTVSKPSRAKKPRQLAIKDYDTLGVRAIRDQLEGLAKAQLEALLAHEEANKGRVTLISDYQDRLGL